MNEQGLAAVCAGDVRVFNQLVLRYQRLVYNLAYRILGDPDAAADVTQDAFLSAYRSARQFRGGSLKSWLMRIVTNACYSYLRARKRCPASSLDDWEDESGRQDTLVDRGERPDEYVERQELGQRIQAGLMTLPPDQRIVVILSDVQGLDYREIAGITGLAMGTVKSRLSRARAKLRDYLCV